MASQSANTVHPAYGIPVCVLLR